MNCRFWDSTIEFQPAENGFPNTLKCSCCDWFYEWRKDGLGGDLSRERVESALSQLNGREWLDLKAGRLFIFDGSTELPGSAPINNEVPF